MNVFSKKEYNKCVYKNCIFSMVRAIAPLWCANPLPMLTLLLQPLSEGKKLMTTDCFKTYLQEEFVRRCRNNKAYSLRSFARQLSINHSSLSRILSGKRALSENMIQKFNVNPRLNKLNEQKFFNTQQNIIIPQPLVVEKYQRPDAPFSSVDY